jgi:hypothetical protein
LSGLIFSFWRTSIVILLITCVGVPAQTTPDSLRFLFIGDIMGHDSQIAAARVQNGVDSFAYGPVFQELQPLMADADFVVANLELTLAGPPYKGYPQFSSPDALAEAAYGAGINVMMTANNHSCDRGKVGILRTITVLDSLGIRHTGTFADSMARASGNLLRLSKRGMEFGILNYTYGTNGLPAPAPTLVNLIDTAQIKADLAASFAYELAARIVFLHWGIQYERQPDSTQTQLADSLFAWGADWIIGSHPHVLQRMEWYKEGQRDSLLIYSLGNFVSNQRDRYRDGGAIVAVDVIRDSLGVRIDNAGYYLTWVYKSKNPEQFYIVPAATYAFKPEFFITPGYFNSMYTFLSDARLLLYRQNRHVHELIWPHQRR